MSRQTAVKQSRSASRSTQSSQRSGGAPSSDGSDSSVLDFLGMRHHTGSTTTEHSNRSSTSPESEVALKRTRKQARPKRHDRSIQEIRKMQLTTHLLIPRLPFQRVIRELLQKWRADFRLQTQALEALRESSEMYLVQMFSDAVICAIHAKRVTLQKKDIDLLKTLARPSETL